MGRRKKKQEVRAAGGVVLKKGKPTWEVLLVGRYTSEADIIEWQFPKGLVDYNETFQETAKREILEETGYDIEVGVEVGNTFYYYNFQGITLKKLVIWYLCKLKNKEPISTIDGEVDIVCWKTVDEAELLLSFSDDVTILQDAVRQNIITKYVGYDS